MSDVINENKLFAYQLGDATQRGEIRKMAKALDSEERLAILKLLEEQPMTVPEIAERLSLPLSTAALHVKILSDAQFVFVDYKPTYKGQIKLCSRSVNRIEISFHDEVPQGAISPEETIEMPVGNYFEADITAPCGLAGKETSIGVYDSVASFYLPERTKAELLWFQKGHVSYLFPFLRENHPHPVSLSFSFEICSETVYSRNDWPSDITVWVNDQELLTFTSPGDFGGRRGHFTPEYWFINSTQFGLLKEIRITDKGVFLDGIQFRKDLTIDDLKTFERPAIKLTIGIKDDAVHKGGMNLFGKNFGDYNQAIVMKLK
jgi:predicted transcriptional regulator